MGWMLGGPPRIYWLRAAGRAGGLAAGDRAGGHHQAVSVPSVFVVWAMKARVDALAPSREKTDGKENSHRLQW